MRVHRCSMLFVELDAEPRFDFATLLAGGDGLDRSTRWQAYAPHLGKPVPVTLAQLAVLDTLGEQTSIELDALLSQHDPAAVQALLDAGLLLGDDAAQADARARNATAAAVAWWPPALVAQAAGGWDGIDIQARYEAGMMPTCEQLVGAHGRPPSHEYVRRPDHAPLPLAPPSHDAFDTLLAERRTCRNFDGAAAVSAEQLSTMLLRVWGATGTLTLAPDAVAVKKTSPAGGGLHAVEAYLLVQRAEGLAPGLYHYLPLQHALEPLQTLDSDAAAALAHRFVAGQNWFTNVPVMVVMAARFDRLFWKYRRHSKAWRVVHLDVGHLSQTMYLSAADLGLGAFVTAAINDREIEPALGLEPLREGVIAIVGFGPRAAIKSTIELDDLVPTAASRLRDG
jgi:putative peptide maturation dehydrogenase